jgi:hypothetical protein
MPETPQKYAADATTDFSWPSTRSVTALAAAVLTAVVTALKMPPLVARWRRPARLMAPHRQQLGDCSHDHDCTGRPPAVAAVCQAAGGWPPRVNNS